jgi:hypothetical protein
MVEREAKPDDGNQDGLTAPRWFSSQMGGGCWFQTA